MRDLRILHITDLHLANFFDTSENLRKAYYKEYLDGLHSKVAEVINEPVDAIFATGDFIDKGRVSNYQYVKIVIDYISEKFGVSKELISVCLGNHDFILSEDAAGNHNKAREDFKLFEENYNKHRLIVSRDFFKIFLDETLGYYLIIFDSTWGCNGKNVPGRLSDAEIDEVIVCLDENIAPSMPLFILSHYPMIIFNRSQVASQIDNWVDEHLWKSGHIIVERIYRKRPKALTIWFFGDAHLPDFWSYNDYHHFLMTGMLGGNYKKQTYTDSSGQEVAFHKTNEAKVIVLKMSEVTIHTFSYKSRSYDFTTHSGEWEHTVSTTRIVDNPFERFAKGDVSNKILSENKSVNESVGILQQISVSVEEEIMAQIREKKLYAFNRFATSPNDVALGWVSIARLFENNELLGRCIEKMSDWLIRTTKTIGSKDNTIFIGVDFWGAILASQCSMKMNIENYCIATKFRGTNNVLFEKPEFLKEKLVDKMDVLENIVFFTDVISTGNTIFNIKEKISEFLPSAKKFNWLAASVISDGMQLKNGQLNNFLAVGALCTSLKIPVVANSDLPGEDILPVRFSMI